ncbi:MAG: tetratricopeptide repeat protein [Saprospiraceae bacterium]|nr:tetratricopeptide repeat protein [Saprospiraceae bacterium]
MEQLDARGRFQNVVSSLSALFITESLMRPLVLFLEDGHWYDEVSKSFLNDFVKRIRNFPIVLIVTSRYAENSSVSYLVEPSTLQEYMIESVQCDLNLLSPDAIEYFAMQKLKGTISEEFHKLLIRTTNGNPFYLEQVLEYFEESDLLVKEEDDWTIKDKNIKLSNSINAILTARIDRLSSLVKETVKTAAVIGQEFELPVLSEVMRIQEAFIRANGNAHAVLKDQVQQAERGQIWQAINELRYIFQHSLLREAVYSMQLNTRLKELHLQIAEAIEKLYADSIEQRYFDLAFHYEQADLTEKTDFYLRKAADYARRNFQNQLALSYYTKILERVKDKTEQVKLLQVQGQVLERVGLWEKARTTYWKALETARQLNDKYLLGLTNNSYGKLLLLQGNYQDARLHLEIGATFFEFIADSEGISKAYVNLGDLYFRQGEYEEAKIYYTKSIEYAKQSKNISPDAQSFANLGLIHMNQGNYETAIQWQKEGIALSSQNNDKPGLANLYTSLGIVYFEKGDYENALAYYKQGLNSSKELGDKQIEAIATGCIGRVYERQGDYEMAMENFVHDLQICQELGDKQGRAIVLGLIGDLYSLRGEFDQAIQTIEQGLALSRELGYQKGIAKALNTLGDIHYFTNDFETSLNYYDQAIEVTRKIDNKLVLGFSLVEKSRSLLASYKLDDVPPAQQESMTLAMELGNPDLIFEATILTAKLLFQQGQIQNAIYMMQELVAQYTDRGKLATIYYEWSKIEPHQLEYKQKALELNQTLYQATPQFAFKRRIEELHQLQSN